LRDGHLARNDANTVDLDVETTEMSKNTVMITALDGVLRRQSNIFSSILDASSKLS
ncbi:flagellar basal body rod protein FlgB, partial [Escherichia coli]|nr:flagellar basal body rod protein FlgB [Escherichia coli]